MISSGITWALFALAAHPQIQAKLRSELSAVRTDRPSMDELNSLTYLDATIRETMRLHSPVPITERVATTDTVIPLDSPYVDKKGVQHTTVRYVRKVIH